MSDKNFKVKNGIDVNGTSTIVSSSTSATTLVIKAISSQSSSLQQWQDSGGTVLASISNIGAYSNQYGVAIAANIVLGSGSGPTGYPVISIQNVTSAPASVPTGGGNLYVEGGALKFRGSAGITAQFEAYAATDKPLILKGFASQTANLQEWQNSAGTVLTSISASGKITSSTDATINSITVGLGGGSQGSNIALGGSALNSNTTGFGNSAIGYASLQSNTTGWGNTAIGSYALQYYSGNVNTAIGYLSLRNATSEGLVAVGYGALASNTSAYYNTAVGYSALYSTVTGGANAAFGTFALNSSTGDRNIAMGFYAGKELTTGTDSVFLGSQAGQSFTTGSSNIIIGSYAAWYGTSTGSNNVIIGRDSGGSNITGNNNIVIGANTQVSDSAISNEITMGNSSHTKFRIQGTGFVSDTSKTYSNKQLDLRDVSTQFTNSGTGSEGQKINLWGGLYGIGIESGRLVNYIPGSSGNYFVVKNSYYGSDLFTVSGTGNVSVSSDLTISGNLTVNGTTTNLNSINLVIEDKNIILADVATPTDTTADGGGITLKGATDKTIAWSNTSKMWESSDGFKIISASSSVPTLITQAASAQTANIQEWKDASGNIIAKIGPLYGSNVFQFDPFSYGAGAGYSSIFIGGRGISNEQRAAQSKFGVTTGEWTLGALRATDSQVGAFGATASLPVFTVKSAASQSANLVEIKDSSDVMYFSITPPPGTAIGGGGIQVRPAGTGGRQTLHSGQAYGGFGITTTTGQSIYMGTLGGGGSLEVVTSDTYNRYKIQGNGTGVAPILTTDGLDTDVNMNIYPKGAGKIGINTTSPTAYVHVKNSSSSNVGFIVEAATGQTSTNIFEVQRAGGGDSSFGVSHNYIDLNRNTTAAASMTVYGANAGAVPLYVKGRASQTANLQEWQNSSGTTIASIANNGELTLRPIPFAGGVSGGIYMQDTSNAWVAGSFQIKVDGGGIPRFGFTAPNASTEALTIKGNSVGVQTSSPGAAFQVTSNGASNIVSIIKGVASQTANLTQWQDSTASVIASVNAYGDIYAQSMQIHTDRISPAMLSISTGYLGNQGIVLRAMSGQTANLQEWQDSSGNILTTVKNNGEIENNLTRSTRTNYSSIPAGTAHTAATNKFGWLARWYGGGTANGTVTPVTGATDGPIPELTSYLRKTWTAINANGAHQDVSFSLSNSATSSYPVSPGDIHTVSFYFRHSWTDMVGGGSFLNRLYFNYFNSAGTQLQSAYVTEFSKSDANTWTRISDTQTAPANAAYLEVVHIYYSPTNSVTVGGTMDVTGQLIEKTNSLGSYFDGSTSQYESKYNPITAWTGTANSSTSTVSYISQSTNPLSIKSSSNTVMNIDQYGAITTPAINISGIAVSKNISTSSGYRYFVDTTAARTLTLPASPSVGAEVQVFDASNSAGTYNITIDPNGAKIEGVVEQYLIDVNGAAVTMTYTGSTFGWKVRS